jgi:hypothetical protein
MEVQLSVSREACLVNDDGTFYSLWQHDDIGVRASAAINGEKRYAIATTGHGTAGELSDQEAKNLLTVKLVEALEAM